MEVALVIIILIIGYFLTRWYKQIRQYNKLLEKYPSPPTVPIFGNALDFKSPEDFIPTFAKYTKLYGDKIKLNFGIFSSKLLISDVRLVNHLLSSSNNLKKGTEYQYLTNWLGRGLLLSDGDDTWKKHRKIISSSFNTQTFKEFIEVFESNANVLVKKLKNELGKPSFDIYHYIRLCSLDIICETTMGTSICAQDNSELEYVKSVKFMCKLLIKRAFSPFLRTNYFYNYSNLYKKEKHAVKTLHDYTTDVIKKRKQYRKNAKNDVEDKENNRRLVLLDLLLQQNEISQTFTDVELREEVDTFMFAGHDTTASALTFAIFCLAENPEVQAKVMHELEEILGDDLFRSITFNDVQSMKYLEAVIKEVLRLYPSVPYYSRSVETQFEYDGHIIPKGISLIMNIYGIHHSSELFPEPETFRPERFLNATNDDRSNYGYFPFSAGPRNCIGQKFAMIEMKTILTVLLRHYQFLSAVPKHTLKISTETVLFSSNGVCVRITKRNT